MHSVKNENYLQIKKIRSVIWCHILFWTLQIDVPDEKNQTPGYAYEGAACRLNVMRTMRNLRLQQLVNEVSAQVI